MRGITYWLAEHPAIVGFRWSHAQSWGSTWSFLFSAIVLYLSLSLFLHLALHLAGRRRPVPLGPFPALHSLAMALASAAIFLGILLSSLAEIRDTRWFWRRTKTTPFQWLLCFPLGTRPTGRVFFWSYAFYLSRFLHLLRTFFAILRRRPRALGRLFSHSALVCMSFLWLEFSQSFQVVAILSATLAHVVVFGYRFWLGVRLPVAGRGGAASCFPMVVVACQVALLGCNLVCHLGVLLLHLSKGGCNGIGAWLFNSVLNAALLVLFVDFHVKRAVRRRKGLALDDDCGSVYCHQTNNSGSSEPSKEQ
ncbi:elongation of fatty acids protein 3-like [Phoenix dactylifera]|uniref:Elongation of fatty acids protein 3-like n=1 Tax=Phoenix dactylifera TaxID=42345 RepID=A0A8B7CY25_PHODC|nr:elongation of fatty acids protein 3-like [Phoenix dactylifera]